MSAALAGDRLFVTQAELPQYGVPFSRVHLWRMEAAGQFPRRVKLSERRVAWALSEILEWAAQRRAARPGVVPFEVAKRASGAVGRSQA